MKTYVGETFEDQIDVEETSNFVGCTFKRGVWFRDSGADSLIVRSDIWSNSKDPVVRSEPSARGKILYCDFFGSRGPGVLLSGGMSIEKCYFAGEWNDNIIQPELDWGGGVVSMCHFDKAAVAKNSVINARHGGDSTFTLEHSNVYGKRIFQLGANAGSVRLLGNYVEAPPSPPNELYFSYQSWDGDEFPLEHAGNHFVGAIRTESGDLEDGFKEAPLKRNLSTEYGFPKDMFK